MHYWFTPTIADDAQEYKLGSVGTDEDGKVYIYLHAGERCREGRGCRIHTSHSDARLLSTNNDRVGDRFGVPQVEVPDDKYGWFQVYGEGVLSVAGATNSHTQLRTSGNAGRGRLRDGSSGGQVAGVILLEDAGSTGLAPAVFNWPVVTSV